MQNISTTIRRLKIHALQRKKEHFNAAERKQIVRYWMGVPVVLLNVISAIILCETRYDGFNPWLHYIPLIAVFATVLLILYQMIANPAVRAEAHRRIAKKYCAVVKKINRLEAYLRDNLLGEEEIIRRIEQISGELDDISTDALTEPTTEADYMKVK